MGKSEKAEITFKLLDMERLLHGANHAEKILQITSDTLILIDKDGICVDISIHSNLWFLQEDKLLGSNIFNLLPIHTLEKILPEFQNVLSSQIASSKNYKLILGDETYYFKCIMYPYESMVLCQYRDITERSNVKLELERRNQELKEIQKAVQMGQSEIKRLNQILDTVLENLPAGIVVKDIENDFRYIYRNRESYNREVCNNTIIEATDFDYYPKEIAEQKRKEDLEIVATQKGMHWITEGKDKNGKLLILDKQKIMVKSEDFSPIIVSIEWNITQLELMKRELLLAKEKAETSDKLKSAFLANMSHEIRTPLNAIVGFSRIIAESESAEERQEYYEIVEANNERLLQLINEILDLSKIESGIVDFKIGPVNISRLCKDVYDAHVFRCPQEVELIAEPSEELHIDSDSNRLFQVFSNLIGNAFKFTTQGSISYGYKREGDVVKFHVTDTGIGIEPEKVHKVFERFAKLNTFAQGTGLGLSICKTIIERLGGSISVTSEWGKGTTFTFTLPHNDMQKESLEVPISTEDSQREEKSQPVTTSMKAKNEITILIAEDTDSNYDLLNAILGKTYRLVRACDGMEAVTMFDEVKPDLILMDIKMPNLDGLEATKIIRELSSDVPIIAQSAYAYEHDRRAAEEAGCNDFLSKPIAQNKLKETITKWLNN